MFLRNAGYVAGWSHEIGRFLTQRWIAGEPIVLSRKEAGGVAALEDRCRRRRAALSMGKLIGDTAQLPRRDEYLRLATGCADPIRPAPPSRRRSSDGGGESQESKDQNWCGAAA